MTLHSSLFARRHAGSLVALGALLAVLVVGVLGFVWWLSSQWFVGSHVGYVTVYQGIPQSIAGVSLNRVASQTALPTADLPYFDQQQVEATIDAPTQAEAERIVADLETKASACRADPAPLGCPIVPAGGSGGSATASPSASASPSPTATGAAR